MMLLHITVMSDESDSATSKRADQKRKAAARSRSYRDRLRADRIPTARDVDSAISEALAFHIAKARARGGGVDIDVHPLIQTIMIIIEREGYRRHRAAEAIASRMTTRPEHMDPHNVPSHCPGPADRMRPTKLGDWKTPMDEILAHLSSV